jgi:hypothetical protein
MAKSKKPAAKSEWLKIRCRVNQLLLIAPAEQALAWGGSQATGQVVDEDAADTVFDRLTQDDFQTADVEGGSVLLWKITEHYMVRVRATPDEIMFVDSRLDTSALGRPLTGKVTPRGKRTCSKLLVAMGAPFVITDLQGVEERSVAALAPLAGNALETKTRGSFGGGAILPATGAYRVETGAGKDGRWLRFVRG